MSRRVIAGLGQRAHGKSGRVGKISKGFISRVLRALKGQCHSDLVTRKLVLAVVGESKPLGGHETS